MTIFVILNSDQEHPFFLDFQNDREKGVSDSTSNLLKKYLKRKCFPTFSPSYLMQQFCYYQRLRLMFYELLNYEPNDQMIGEQHPKLCSYWNQKSLSPIFHCQFHRLQQFKSTMKN